MPPAKPVIFFAFANDREGKIGYLRLAEEARGVREALAAGRAAGLWEVEVRADCTLAEILDVFQTLRDRIAIFHFGGHAGSYELLLQLADGRPGPIDAAGLAALLGQQRGLQLVFLNGCSTGAQTQGLLDANVSAVITTSSSIQDEVATDFASRFYKGLASGAGVQVAFDESAAAVRMARGGVTRDVYREEAEKDGGWPWELHFRNGAEEATGRWSLGEAAGDPLFGTPPVPRGDLPEVPYRHLQWFSREHAEVFFGRGQEIRELYQRVTSGESPPVLLLYGQSGVGKSSLLDAGLLPRLEGSYQTRYARRTQGLGLLGTLQHALGNEAAGVTAAEAWRALEQSTDQPVLVVLDQAEECFTRPDAGRPTELAELATALVETFRDPVQRPRGKLVLSFRKEWLAEIEAALAEAKLPRAKIFLARLGREGIIEAVTGPARVPRLRDQWGLTIDDGLAEFVADELLEDPDSNIGPTLQILLTKMWAEATKTDASHPRFDRELYLSLKRKGVLLKDFLDQQLEELRYRWDTSNAMADTGLALDILHYHTTPLGTAERRTVEEMGKAYGHVGRLMSRSMKGAGYVLPEDSHSGFVASRIQDFKDLSLLVDDSGDQPADGRATRLTHDTLAPLIRREFDNSAKLGQLARRIIESRAHEWTDGRDGTPLDERDLGLVEGGSLGMRDWTDDEKRLIEASRRVRAEDQRKRRIQRAAGITALALITVFAGVAVWKWVEADNLNTSLQEQTTKAEEAADIARSDEYAAMSEAERGDTAALALAVVAAKRAQTHEAERALRSALHRTGRDLILHRNNVVSYATFSPDGQRVVTASQDHTAAVWPLAHPESAETLQAGKAVLRAEFSPDGRRVLIASDEESARIWNPVTRAVVPLCCHHDGDITYAEFSADGRRVVTAGYDGIARIWDSAGRERSTLGTRGPRVWYAAFSPDGKHVATGSDDGSVRLWDISTATSVLLAGHTGAVVYAAFDSQSRRLVTASKDGTARIWALPGQLSDTTRNSERVLRHQGEVNSAVFSPDGQRVVTASDDLTARVWDAETGNELKTLSGHLGYVRYAEFSPDGFMIVTASDDSTSRLWSISGELLAILRGHQKAVLHAAFSPDSRLVVTASEDGTARVFITHFSELLDSADAMLNR